LIFNCCTVPGTNILEIHWEGNVPNLCGGKHSHHYVKLAKMVHALIRQS